MDRGLSRALVDHPSRAGHLFVRPGLQWPCGFSISHRYQPARHVCAERDRRDKEVVGVARANPEIRIVKGYLIVFSGALLLVSLWMHQRAHVDARKYFP